jgi:hypothetical protein
VIDAKKGRAAGRIRRVDTAGRQGTIDREILERERSSGSRLEPTRAPDECAAESSTPQPA